MYGASANNDIGSAKVHPIQEQRIIENGKLL